MADAKRRLRRFRNPPLVEALWELRFEPGVAAATDVLLGKMYAFKKGEDPQIFDLPGSEIPAEAAMNLPPLRYAGRKRLQWSDNTAIQLGERTISLHALAEGYKGWESFSHTIRTVIKAILSRPWLIGRSAQAYGTRPSLNPPAWR